MKKRLVISGLVLTAALLALLAVTSVFAADNQGTEFWLAFPLNHDGTHVPDALELYITGKTTTNGTVSVPGLSWSTAFNVTAGTITTITIPVGAELKEAELDVVSQKGIHVTATDQVVVYGMSFKRTLLADLHYAVSADAYLGLPVDALGTDYLVMAYPTDNLVDSPGSQFTVVGTQDNTTVVITPTADTYSYLQNTPYTINLDAGQTFMSYVDYDYGGGNDLTGTDIHADKPIAVFGGNRCANIPVGFQSCDYVVEQLPPLTAWGQNFAAMPLATYDNTGTYRILPAQDNTQVTINGVPLATTLDRGGVYEDNTLTTPLHITSDKPILVAQYANGQTYEGPGTCVYPVHCAQDPFMMMLPSASEWRTDYVVNTPNHSPQLFTANYLNIVAPTAISNSLSLDGSLIPVGSFTSIGDGTFSGAQVAVGYGAHALSAAQPFGVFVYGFVEEGSYGYPGGSGNDPSSATGVIGHAVWLDENGDGVQDAGESGLPNVIVQLYSGSTLIMTTTTDASGGYLFSDVPIGTYTIRVDTSAGSLPAGLAANPTYDENGGGDSQSVVTLTANGEEHLTANFGYNWVSPTDSTNPLLGATGAIGNRVWNDADGDGRQDPGEAGLAGVTVRLLTDDNGDGVYGGVGDNPATTTTTDAAGYFIFDNLKSGSYVISVTTPGGYTQTGDPDESGACTACDGRTTSPIVLDPGDVYLNADFGYHLDSGGSAIGQTVFVDTDGDGVVDAGEPGIPGVTVALLDSNGKVIATTITDADGHYTFPGLPAGTYTVRVTDTNNVLGELNPISDADGIGTPNRSTVTVDGTLDSLGQNFGYAPPNHAGGDGMLGNFVYRDADGDGTFDPGEPGLEGITVTLTTSGGVTTTVRTDENGFYFFGNLPADTYTITVSLPSGMAYSDDPDVTLDGSAAVTLGAGEINLNQTFGLEASTPNIVSGTIWRDTDGQGDLDESSAGLANVTVVIRDSAGNIVGTTVTDANGDYSFPGLPNGTYTVDVTDDANILDGYWHSLGTDSKPDPYTVTVTGGVTNATADFGYYRQPAALGGFIWEDFDQDGLQDGGEAAIPNVQVELVVAYPNGDVITVTTTTDSSGLYSFGNLLADEDYLHGGGGGEPSYRIIVPPHQMALAGYGPTTVGAGDGTNDSDDHTGVNATPAQGATDDTFDFGYKRSASVGGTLWNDVNPDSVLGTGDAFLGGVTVRLYDATGTTLLMTTTTDTNGNYVFNGITPGDYVIAVPAPGFGYSIAGGPDPDNNLDNDDNGVPTGSGGVRSLPVTLEPLDGSQNGSEPDTAVDGDNNRSNRTVDFGFTNTPTAITLNSLSATAQPIEPPGLIGLLLIALLMAGLGGWWFVRRELKFH